MTVGEAPTINFLLIIWRVYIYNGEEKNKEGEENLSLRGVEVGRGNKIHDQLKEVEIQSSSHLWKKGH
jgi:hypothetical protein